MPRNIVRTGKKSRPKTAVKGKRYRCARCRKRSPKPVKTPAPWYCSNCSLADSVATADRSNWDENRKAEGQSGERQ
jgi:late competence protein required for DNA uptake (superfamily II DNA/RNA helicase)